MPAIKQNKLTPVLAALAVAICGYVVWSNYASGDPPAVRSGGAMEGVPGAKNPADERQGGLLGLGALSASAPSRSADADSPGETLKTVTASNREMLAKVQQVVDQNQELMRENAKLRGDRAEIVAQVRQEVVAQLKTSPDAVSVQGAAAPAAAAGAGGQAARAEGLGGIVDAATDGYSSMVRGLGHPNPAGIPGGLGYDGAATHPPSGPSGGAANGAHGAAYVRVLPVGYREAQGGDGSTGVVRANGQPLKGADAPVIRASLPGDPASDLAGAGDVANMGKKRAKPYFTIPENATLTRASLMTALVGRVPIDGRVQDPMQFKLLIGRENLAANGHYVPDDIAGIVVSGIAVGDMALKCSEGLVQSLTFVFTDGTIHTESMKKNGSAGGFGGGGGGISGANSQSPSVSQSNKLAWLSDERGNPCIPGTFVTNAPAYLTDVVSLKALSIAAQASALSQTTTYDSAFGSSTAVTGNKNSYVLGQAAGAATNEVSSWIMRRLNNSFDAVVTPADTKVVVHIEQEISIDKAPDARKLNYGAQSSARGVRHGLD